jgi:hypothetical protein
MNLLSIPLLETWERWGWVVNDEDLVKTSRADFIMYKNPIHR